MQKKDKIIQITNLYIKTLFKIFKTKNSKNYILYFNILL